MSIVYLDIYYYIYWKQTDVISAYFPHFNLNMKNILYATSDYSAEKKSITE